MGFGGFGGRSPGPTEVKNRWMSLLKLKKGTAPEGGFDGFGGTQVGGPKPPKTRQERERDEWREIFAPAEPVGAEVEGCGAPPPTASPQGRWTARFKEQKCPQPPSVRKEPRYEVVDQVEQAIEDQAISALNNTGIRIKVRSHAYGTELWLVPDGDTGPGDGLPVFTVEEVTKLWAAGSPDSELLTTILAIKMTLGGKVADITPLDRVASPPVGGPVE